MNLAEILVLDLFINSFQFLFVTRIRYNNLVDVGLESLDMNCYMRFICLCIMPTLINLSNFPLFYDLSTELSKLTRKRTTVKEDNDTGKRA